MALLAVITEGAGDNNVDEISELSMLRLLEGELPDEDGDDTSSSLWPAAVECWYWLISLRLYSFLILLTASSEPWCKFLACLNNKSLLEKGREQMPHVKGFNLLWVLRVCLVKCSSLVKALLHCLQLYILGLPSGVLVP